MIFNTPLELRRIDNREAALALAQAGYAIFPANFEKVPLIAQWQKRATKKPRQIKAWFEKHPDAIPALPTGRINGIAVLDIDRKNGKDGFKGLRKRGFDPSTLSEIRYQTPSGGEHHFFTWPDGMGNSAAGLPTGVDVRGDGGYVIAPGAITENGEYKCLNLDLLNKKDRLAPWPPKLLPNKVKKQEIPLKTGLSIGVLKDALMFIPNDNPDRDWWMKLGAALHFETEGSEDGLQIFDKWSSQYVGYSMEKTEDLWNSLGRKEGALVTGYTIIAEAKKHGWIDPRIAELFDDPSEEDKVFEANEDGVLKAIMLAYKEKLRFNHSMGKWLIFDGQIWRVEEIKRTLHFIRQIATGVGLGNKGAKSLFRVSSWEAIERGARSVPEFSTISHQWNSNPFLLGTPSGTVDLKTGSIRQGSYKDLISKSTAVSPTPLNQFDPEVDCPRWMKLLREALNGNEEMIEALQRWAGYCLTGKTEEQRLLFVYGIGGSGKSTVINTIAKIMGDYAINIPTSLLTKQKYEAHPEGLARLDGARMVWCSETEQGDSWAENRIKSLTGGDPVTARYMRQHTFQFDPQFSLIIVGNNQPSLSNVDEAITRRFIIFPFNNPPDSKDPALPEKLQEEWPGILSWAIQGCLDWQNHGLLVPKLAQEATDSYFSSQDLFSQWIEDYCVIDTTSAEKTSALYEEYSNFMLSNGERPLAKNKGFPEKMKQRGFSRINGKYGIDGRGFMGLRLKNDFDLAVAKTLSEI